MLRHSRLERTSAPQRNAALPLFSAPVLQSRIPALPSRLPAAAFSVPSALPRVPVLARKRMQRAVLLRPEVQQESSAEASLPADALVPCQFTWPNGGTEVQLWGSWNNWSSPLAMHQAAPGAPHRAIVPLRLGFVEYKFKVDGAWKVSLQEETVGTKDGTKNNCKVVVPTATFKLDAPSASQVAVVGDWDGWKYAFPLERSGSSGSWHGFSAMRPGQYCYQYITDARVVHSPAEEAGVYPGRGVVNMGWAQDQAVFKILYQTGWEQPVLWYRRVAAEGGRYTQEFTPLTMCLTGSRSADKTFWFSGVVVPLQTGESLEFYISNGKTGREYLEDRPGPATNNKAPSNNGATYTAPVAGCFKLARGVLRTYSRGNDPRFMLVSDIDGTMIADDRHPSQFGSTNRFKKYWEAGPAICGSILVYNTGRSLGQINALLSLPEVAMPDALIAAVGTKVYVNTDGMCRSHTSGKAWVEDAEYSRSLDEGWDLSKMRRFGQEMVQRWNDPGTCNILDDGEEHEHRYSLSVHVSVVDEVLGHMSYRVSQAGLAVRPVVSGEGSHRYVDFVPMAGGKEKALQFLRAKYGVPDHLVVAAGDSGNDILMMEGNHPSIVVGNAQPALLRWLLEQPQGGKVILTEAEYADGILEGLARHGLF